MGKLIEYSEESHYYPLNFMHSKYRGMEALNDFPVVTELVAVGARVCQSWLHTQACVSLRLQDSFLEDGKKGCLETTLKMHSGDSLLPW